MFLNNGTNTNNNKDFPDTVFTVSQFWLPFSTWMAKNSQQLVLYVSGSAKEFFPLTPTTIFETHELPYLDPPRVKQLVALHLPPPNTSPIKCKDDKVSFNHLEKVKSTLKYYCCNLPTFVSADKSAKDIKTVAKEVTDAINQGTCVPWGVHCAYIGLGPNMYILLDSINFCCMCPKQEYEVQVNISSDLLTHTYTKSCLFLCM